MARAHDNTILIVVNTCLLLMMITQEVFGYPRPFEYPDSDEDKSEESSEVSALSGPNKAVKPQDEISRLIETAIANGELISPDEWYSSRRRNNVQRDTSRYTDTHVTKVGVKLQSESSPSQQGQRRLFERREDSPGDEMMQSDGKIVFPDMDNRSPNVRRPVPVCQRSTFCDSTPYYPDEVVNRAINQNNTFRYLAGIDEVSDIIQRIDTVDDVPLCVSTEQVVFPKSAESKQKEWLFIVNQENFKQGVRIETCNNEDGECSVIDGLAEGYKTSCKQKFIYRQLAAVVNGTITPEMFRLPSSCCCHVKFTGNPLTRMGINIGEQKTTPARTRRKK